METLSYWQRSDEGIEHSGASSIPMSLRGTRGYKGKWLISSTYLTIHAFESNHNVGMIADMPETEYPQILSEEYIVAFWKSSSTILRFKYQKKKKRHLRYPLFIFKS